MVHLDKLYCDFQGRKINFAISRPLVDVAVVSRPTVTRVTFDLPECREPLFKKWRRNASKKKKKKKRK